MPRVSLLLLQAASATTSPDERLLHPVPRTACHASAAEIVVCGKDADTYRLPDPVPPPGDTGPPKADFGLAGTARLNLHGAQRSLGAIPAPAAMATISIPF